MSFKKNIILDSYPVIPEHAGINGRFSIENLLNKNWLNENFSRTTEDIGTRNWNEDLLDFI